MVAGNELVAKLRPSEAVTYNCIPEENRFIRLNSMGGGEGGGEGGEEEGEGHIYML